MEDEKFYAEINLKFDSTKTSGKQLQIVKEDEITISSLIGALIHNLLEQGFDRHMLEYAIEEGLKEKREIQVKKIHITKENEKAFEELLKKITGEDK